jgi:hypothetical protein
MATLNKITGIVVGQIGEAVVLQAVDDDGIAIDLTVYTAAALRAVSEDAQETLAITCSFVAASGGTFSFTPSSTGTFGRPGDWEAQVQFSDTGILALTIPFIIEVSKQI